MIKLLETLTDVAPPQTRSAAKRKDSPDHPDQPLTKKNRTSSLDTPIQTLFVDNMTIDQLWEQLELRGAKVCENLQVLDGDGEDGNDEEEGGLGESDDDEFEDNEDSDSESSEEQDEEDDNSLRGEEVAALQDNSSQEEDEDGNISEEEDGPSSLMLDVIRKKAKPAASKAKHSELDDGFFDLEEFNAETEEAESKSASKGRLRRDSGSEDSDDLESDVDLFDVVHDTEGVDDDMTGGVSPYR